MTNEFRGYSVKVAIVHDALISYDGPEQVLEQLIDLFPKADLFAVVDFFEEKDRAFLKHKNVTTTMLQNIPFAKRLFRYCLPIMPYAIEQLDLSKYDLIISSSHRVAKGVLTGPNQLHISYIHSPIRYAWDMHHHYLSFLTRMGLFFIRNWDVRSSNSVDYFISNSRFSARRIWKYYRRDAITIYPPVRTELFSLCEEKDDYYVTYSKLVPYNNVRLLVEAFSDMPDKKLIVIGDGTQKRMLRKIATPNISFLGDLPEEEIVTYIQRAKAFLNATEDDFDIRSVEAQSCGTPVITYGNGSALETVRGLGYAENPTGLFFEEKTTSAVIQAVQHFEKVAHIFKPTQIHEHAESFSSERFRKNILAYFQERVGIVEPVDIFSPHLVKEGSMK